MVEKIVTVKNKLGIHARPAAILVRTAAKFNCSIMLVKNGIEINGKSIMSVMSLAAEPGSQITIRTDGENEKEALETILELFENKFEEE
jgi:phosphocarrier protein HPr